ncbi:MAG: HAD-IIB family hydrolase [Defluviitaleaceae bacterium]|nr:HAD-IIB family hydrolase [Defluviitaleaceae bacterium]
MYIKMIVCDLDGTLLRTDKSVSKYTLDMLNKCRAMGVKFAIATARNRLEAAPCIDILEPDVLIFQGGALAIIDDETVYSKNLDTPDAIEILEGLLKKEGVLRITSGGEVYSETKFAGRYPDKLHNISALFSAPLEDFGRNLHNIGIIQYRDENLVRFAHRDATKWRAVQACAAYMGIETANIVAFGDDAIDVDMIENCGIGVAMGNAIDAVKAVTDHVCDTNDRDGVAKWLEQNLILEE